MNSKNRSGDLLVSAITVCRNSKNMIKRCLDSILNQTYSNIEIVVVDSSDDGTENIIEEYQKRSKFPFKIIYQEPKGVGIARNTGIENSDGDIIILVDADCFIPDNFVEKVIDPFIESKKVLSVCTEIKAYSSSNSLFSKLVNTYDDIMCTQPLGKSERICQPIVRKELYSMIGKYNPNLKSGEDTEFGNRLQNVRERLKAEGYEFPVVGDVTYYEEKQGQTFFKYYKKCIWYGEPLANMVFFKSNITKNTLKILGILYFSSLPFLLIGVLVTQGEIIHIIGLLIPFLLSLLYLLYRALMNNKFTLFVFFLPFLLIYKSIGLLIGMLISIIDAISSKVF